ncbi:MAG: dockerin type I repeat-containing protein [Clostridia bacterium]|nr:dockerin type I repeat-containing protein [Clostridia bacterium]
MAKKVLSIALALLMIFNVFAVAVSATVWTTEDAVITLKTDDTKPMPGDEVTVTVALQNNYNVHALQIMVAYDKNYYEVVGTADNAFTNLLVSDGAKFTGVAQAHLDAAAQEAMYAGLYSDAQKAQFGLVRIGYVWLASLASDAGETATPVFTNATDLASFKLKVKADAPTDGKGVIMVDPVFVVEEGVDTPAFDTRSATYVGKGATTISASATQGKLYGLPINVDGAKFAGCAHVAGAAVKENDVAADCVTAGSYDMVTYCTLCNEELSRETTTVEALGHTPAEAVEENRIEATATENGSYDMVVYCTVCGAEISRESFVIEALGHTAGDEVIENEVAADCVNAGSYDKVVYCTCCEPKVELSRETVTVPALGHTEGEAVEENRIPATPTENGSYEMVVYCTVCGAEISRESFVIEALGHYSGEPVEENRVEATCTEAGSYDKVVYCTCCTPAVELSRETIVIEALGHTEAEAVEENRVEADCVNDGSYDMVVYCTVCGAEVSRESFVIDALGHDYEAVVTAPDCVNGGYTTYTCSVCGDSYVADEVEALGHTEAEAVEENRTEADCVNAGSYDMVVYCSVCGEELSRETTVIEALGHTPAEAVEENRVEATMDENGSYDMVVYCSVCGEELSRESFVIPSLGSGPADYTELNALREEAAAIDRSAYSDESLAALDAVLAKITDDMKLPQQDIVDGWADELEAALAGLDRVVEKANAKVQIVLNKASAVKDDVITVTVKLTTNYYVTGVQLPILYDKTLFELVGNEGGMSYLTFDANSSFVNGRYDLNGNSGLTNGFKYTSDAATWNTDTAKAQYDYAWITAAFNNNTNTSKPNTLAMPQDEVFVTFQVKALGDVEDTTEAIFISPDWTKTDTVKAGTFTMGYSDTEVNTKPLTYVTTGMTYNVETIAMEGVDFTGTVETFKTNTDNGEELTTIELIADGEVKYSTTVAGVGVQNFTIEGVEAGAYTVKVSKKDHVTREYEITVEDEAIEEELKIHLKGDIDGNGRLMVTDYNAILKHVKKTQVLEGYAFACADIDGNGRIMVTDYNNVLKHVKKTALLW